MPVWLSWLEGHPITTRLRVQFPDRAHTYITGSNPSPRVHSPWSGYGGNPMMFLSHTDASLSPFLSKSHEKISLDEDLKNNNPYD